MQHGAEVNAQNKKGFRALFRATYKNHPQCVRLLLAAGADVHARTNIAQHARTALEVAREFGHGECYRWLEGYALEDLVEIERCKLEWPEAAANFIQLPSAAALSSMKPAK